MMRRRYGDRFQAEREHERVAVRAPNAARVGRLTGREFELAAVVAYWCEGTKSKTWQRREQVTFIHAQAAQPRQRCTRTSRRPTSAASSSGSCSAERSTSASRGSGRASWAGRLTVAVMIFPGSSKGRTGTFGVSYGGSNPSPGAFGCWGGSRAPGVGSLACAGFSGCTPARRGAP